MEGYSAQRVLRAGRIKLQSNVQYKGTVCALYRIEALGHVIAVSDHPGSRPLPQRFSSSATLAGSSLSPQELLPPSFLARGTADVAWHGRFESGAQYA